MYNGVNGYKEVEELEVHSISVYRYEGNASLVEEIIHHFIT